MPIVHELKTWPLEFQAVVDGRKPFEMRIADRPFAEGDGLILREFVPSADGIGGDYTGREWRGGITYIMHGPIWGLQSGWVCMGIRAMQAPLIANLKDYEPSRGDD